MVANAGEVLVICADSLAEIQLSSLVREGGRLHLPVHIHSAVGIGDYFNLSESNIMNLENVLRDPRYSGHHLRDDSWRYPYEHQAIWLAAMQNVFLDTSLMEFDMYPSEFKHVLKEFLETFPDKITFGTDSFPYLHDNAAGIYQGKVH